MARICILGAGSWGTALAVLLVGNGHTVTLWSHRAEEVLAMQRTSANESKLPGVVLPREIRYSSQLKEAVKNQDLLVFAVPSKATRETAKKIKDLIPEDQKIVSVSKGIEEGTLYSQTQILEDVLKGALTAALSGPSHAEEVVRRIPTLVVAASKNHDLALLTQELFMNANFRVYISPDLLGVEIGGSLKNVIALAAGMSDGLGYGDNTKAALITRGIKEITRLAVAMGAKEDTLAGLSGIGDLIVTCQSMHSRNRMAGYYIGQGDSAQEAMDKVKMVVEGVYSAKAARALGQRYGVDLPIIEQVNRVLFEQMDVRKAVLELMGREKKAELDHCSW